MSETKKPPVPVPPGVTKWRLTGIDWANPKMRYNDPYPPISRSFGNFTLETIKTIADPPGTDYTVISIGSLVMGENEAAVPAVEVKNTIRCVGIANLIRGEEKIFLGDCEMFCDSMWSIPTSAILETLRNRYGYACNITIVLDINPDDKRCGW